MRFLKSFGLIAAAALIGSSIPVHAGIIGASVDVKADFPTLGTVINDGGTKTVDASIEYPLGSFPSYNSDFRGKPHPTPRSSYRSTAPPPLFSQAHLMAFDMHVLYGVRSPLRWLTGASGFNPINISINGQHLLLNYQGVNVSAGASTSIIDVTGTGSSAVPEPASIILFSTGLGKAYARRLVVGTDFPTGRENVLLAAHCFRTSLSFRSLRAGGFVFFNSRNDAKTESGDGKLAGANSQAAHRLFNSVKFSRMAS